jgi:hypothetical protein
VRAQQTTGGLTVQATAGNNVVLLGFDLAAPQVAGLLGFDIQRTDHRGPAVLVAQSAGFPRRRPRTPLRTDAHPVQTFRWGDYTAKPDHLYTYRVVALTGSPGQLSLWVPNRSSVSCNLGIFVDQSAESVAASEAKVGW